MRRKFFTAFASVVSFLMIGAMTADAAEITFGGRIRPRYENWNLPGSNDAQFVDMLVRLQATAKINDNASAFIQLQSNSRWGSQPGANGFSPGGISNPLAGNDVTADVGIHQAYFTLNNLFGAPVDLKLGRQEIILDGHRLFGNTVWTQGMMSHDAFILNHNHGKHTVKYIYSKNQEQSNRNIAGVGAGASNGDVDDTDTHALWANFKGLLGENSSTSAYLVLIDRDCNTPAASFCGGGAVGSADFYTIGARQAGGFGDFTYRGEFYYQVGKSGLAAPGGGTGDVSAYMLGLRAGYKAKNIAMKPSATLWFDYLSGSDAGDVAAGDSSTFNTLFDTGHKYYGLMDFFIQTTLNSGSGTHPNGGLVDYALKLSIQPFAKTTLKADIHHFELAEDFNGPATFGQEVDLTLVHKYSANTKMVVGYSHFFARGLLLPEDADWLYVMLDVNF